MIDLTYPEFRFQQQAHRGTLAAAEKVGIAYAQAVEAASAGERRVWELQSQRDLARHRLATFNSGRFDRERDRETPAAAGVLEEKLASLEAALLAASAAWQEAEEVVIASNQELASLRSAEPPTARIGPALVAEHFAAVASAGDKVSRLEAVLSSLETSLAARRAEHQDRLQQAARAREDARAATLLGECPEAPLVPGALDELDIEDDQAARAGIARRLEQAQAELAAVEAQTQPLRQAVLEQEAEGVRAEHGRVAAKALKLRHRCNDLVKFARIFGVNLAYCRAPLEESVAVEDERTRLYANWPSLFA